MQISSHFFPIQSGLFAHLFSKSPCDRVSSHAPSKSLTFQLSHRPVWMCNYVSKVSGQVHCPESYPLGGFPITAGLCRCPREGCPPSSLGAVSAWQTRLWARPRLLFLCQLIRRNAHRGTGTVQLGGDVGTVGVGATSVWLTRAFRACSGTLSTCVWGWGVAVHVHFMAWHTHQFLMSHLGCMVTWWPTVKCSVSTKPDSKPVTFSEGR